MNQEHDPTTAEATINLNGAAESSSPAMTTMVTVTNFGPPDVMQLVTSELPPPGAHEVEVEVKAIGVNPADARQRAGFFGGSVPPRLGSEAAGVVSAVGEGVSAVRVGDEVIAYRAPGAYATRLVVPETALVPKPPTIPWEEAAGLLLTGSTAMHALDATGVAEGDVVLVHGAAGGVGQMVLQLAAMRGARTLGTSSAANTDLIRELGGEPVQYGDGLAQRLQSLAPHGVNVALDLVGTPEALQVSLQHVHDKSRIASIVPSPAGFDAGIKALGGSPGADPGTDIRNAARAELARMAGEGLLRVRVVKVYPLADVAQAHQLIEGGHVNGKLVLLP